MTTCPDEPTHDSSHPPPPRSEVHPAPHPDQVAENARIGRHRSKEALKTAKEALEVGLRIEEAVGHSPDPARAIEGSGLLLAVTTLIRSFEAFRAAQEERDKIAAAEEAQRRALATAQREAEERRGTVVRWIFLALGALGTAFGIYRGFR